MDAKKIENFPRRKNSVVTKNITKTNTTDIILDPKLAVLINLNMPHQATDAKAGIASNAVSLGT